MSDSNTSNVPDANNAPEAGNPPASSFEVTPEITTSLSSGIPSDINPESSSQPASNPVPPDLSPDRSNPNEPSAFGFVMPEAPPGKRAFGAYPVLFTGSGSEYFKLWIVNLMLSIATLGIYTAWAKVKKLKYMYKNTFVGGANFDYHGDPITILKGRAIATSIFVLYAISDSFSFVMHWATLGIIGLLMPWLILKALRFKLKTSSYRNIRFSFTGSLKESYITFLAWPAVAMLSGTLLYPYAHMKIKEFVMNNANFGTSEFTFEAPSSEFYKPYLKAMIVPLGILAFILISTTLLKSAGGAAIGYAVILITLMVMVGMLSIFILMGYVQACIHNLVWNNTRLDNNRFKSTLVPGKYVGIVITNYILMMLTAGLYKPYADVKIIKYKMESLLMFVDGSIDDFIADKALEADTTDAAGDDVTDLFDIDFAI